MEPCHDPNCQLLFNGICDREQPGPTYEQTSYRCNRSKLMSRLTIGDAGPKKKDSAILMITLFRHLSWSTYFFFFSTDDCFCWAERNETNCERIEETCFEIYDGICGMEKPFDDYVDSGYMCNQ